MKWMSRKALQPGMDSCLAVFFCLFFAAAKVSASNLDTIGLTLLRSVTTNLNGTGIKIVQTEAEASSSSPAPFEVNPANVGLPGTNFTYFEGPPTTTTPTSSTTYPNSIGADSPHGDGVGGFFYGLPGGVSTNVLAIANYEADYFFFTIVPTTLAINGAVVNQSFDASSATTTEQKVYDANYDTYAATYGTLFVSAVGDGGTVYPPSTSYNGIGVAAYLGGSSVGPTPDNGRAKPDITAPGDETSYSTPLVSGAATILIQAALRGDGGSGTNSAADLRTIKALLLNGAIKPLDWTNASPSPLDPRYGSGVLNVFNSYKQLAGGQHGFIQSNSVTAGSAHPPLGSTNNVSSRSGWDFNTVTSSTLNDGINHYYFNLQTSSPNATFTGTMTLVWNRQARQTSINNLDLFLYNTATGALVGSSTSAVDNVEHIFLPRLPQGRYDLQVLKHGGSYVTSTETYGLAFEYFAQPLAIVPAGNNVNVTWPLYPAGFVLQSTTNLASPANWSIVSATPSVTNQQNLVNLPANVPQFFRLSRP